MEGRNWTEWKVHRTTQQPLNKVKEESNGKSITHYDGKSKTGNENHTNRNSFTRMNGTAQPITHIEPSIKSTEFGAIQTKYRQTEYKLNLQFTAPQSLNNLKHEAKHTKRMKNTLLQCAQNVMVSCLHNA
ncbi:MAG: hypothetical protein GY820_46150 [Gammaproteobacteria bacterium]|nr:hypothetical protein [Gammaproteobacteria bacterium]